MCRVDGRSLIAQVTPRQRDEHVLQRRRVRAEFGQGDALTPQLLEDRWHGPMQLGRLNSNGAVLRLRVAHADDLPQGREINSACRVAGRELDEVLGADRCDQ